MGDRLTQLQDCYDQLLDRMYATLTHVSAYHTYSPLPTQSDENPFSALAAERRRRAREEELTRLEKNAEPQRKSIRARNPAISEAAIERQIRASQEEEMVQFDKDVELKLANDGGGLVPESKAVFTANLNRFSRDLMVKFTQIEVLVEGMPALGRSAEEQEEEIRDLERRIREKEREKVGVLVEREEVRDRLDRAILGMRRF